MRLLSLTVERFGPVRKFSVELGPGLNVLYGPNDIGKSNLAEAIRAVLLLSPSSTESKTYVPWGTDATPTVGLTFQVAQDRWRVTKTFGTGSRWSAELQRLNGTNDLHTEATGRDVDGRLRTLLQWGIATPGGRGGPKGLPETYLSNILLGRQSEIASIFSRTLDQDPDESGKRRLTLALQALAQPELFRKVLQKTQDKVELAFDSRGNPRKARGSPFVGVREEVNAAKEKLALVEQELAKGQGVREQLARLIVLRDEQALKVEEARQRRDRAREGATRAAAVREAQVALEASRKGLQQIQDAREAVRRKESEVAAARTAHERAEAALADARSRGELAAQTVRTAEEQLRVVTTERAETALLQRRTLEARRAQAESARDAADRRTTAAQECGKAIAEAEARGGELAQADTVVKDCTEALARTELELQIATARAEANRARELVQAVTQAERDLAERARVVTEATRALETATVAVDRAEEDLQRARERLQAIQGEGSAQWRALKEEELARRALEAEAILREAEAQTQRAREVQAHAERLQRLDVELTALRATEARARADVERAERALVEGQAKVDTLAATATYMDRRVALVAHSEAESHAARVAELRRQADGLRVQAEGLEHELGSGVLPTPEALAAFRALERERDIAEAKIAVGLTVAVRARRAFELQAASDGGETETSQLAAGDEVTCDGRQQVRLVLGDLAELTVIGGQERDHEQARALRARWAVEAEPALRTADVQDLASLEGAIGLAVVRRAELESLRQRIGHLEAQANGLGDASARLETARRRVEELDAALAGHDRAALEREAARLGLLPPPGPLFAPTSPRTPAAVLADLRKQADALVPRLRQELETSRVSFGQGVARVEGLAQQVDAARQAHSRAAEQLGRGVDEVLAEAETRASKARADVERIAAERVSLAAEQSTALTDAERALERATVARDEARKARTDAQQVREQAQSELASLQGQLVLRREAAASVDLAALESRVAVLEAQARTLIGKRPDSSGAADVSRLTARLDAAREALSRGQSERAARAAARDAALSAQAGRVAELAGDWQTALQTAQRDLEQHRTVLLAIQRDLTNLDQDRDAAVAEAQARLQEAAAAQERAVSDERTRAAARDEAQRTLASAVGQLEVIGLQASALDGAAAEASVAACLQALSALPAPDPSLPHDVGAVEAAESAAADAVHALAQLNQDLTRANGQLDVIGGTPLEEQKLDAERALERVRARAEGVELEYAAWKLLKETLELAEKQQTTHLGQALVGPVSQRFGQLTASRYGPLSLGPNLQAHGITAQGELREIERLSAGTRDQLSAILRLTVAAQLKSALVLDDQLAQSDPRRLKWFSDALREAAKTTQVVVLTCRPGDYLEPDELPTQSSTVRDVLDGLVRSVDLGRSLGRSLAEERE